MIVEVELNERTLTRLRQMAEERNATVKTVLQDLIERSIGAAALGHGSPGTSAEEPEPRDGSLEETGDAHERELPEASTYQIKATLRSSRPRIWRRVRVAGDVTLAGLHDILQAVMGWHDRYSHRFVVEETASGVPHPEYWPDVVDEDEVRLNEVAGEGSRFVYEYDFPSGWAHVLEVEKVLVPEPGQEDPVCIKGRRAAPPERMGSMRMYDYFLETMQNPEHPEYPGNPEFLASFGGDFDPARFDLDEVNAALRELG